MRIVRKLAYLSPLLVFAGCTTSDTEPSGGSSASGGTVISSPRTDSSGSRYPASTSSWIDSATDSRLESEIRQSITQDPELTTTASRVQVSSRNGVVTLSGSVPDQQTRDSVTALVRRTPGVVRIADQMYTTATTTSSRASEYGNAAPVFNSAGSSTTTETLSGTGSASGASGQIFSMQVDSLTDTDRNLAQQILQGLRTDTSLSTLLPRVNINVSNGRVVLQGHVQNNEQQRAIEDVVRRAAGSVDVENRLQVRP